MHTRDEIEDALAQYYCSESLHHNYQTKSFGVAYTDGIKTLCEMADCWWLVDLICSNQYRCQVDQMLKEFQVWKLNVNKDKSAILTCFHDADDEAFHIVIPFTDFPLQTITVWAERGTISINGKPQAMMILLLPSEH